ncbi:MULTISPECIES: phosphodiesterase [Paraburkholderia]|uniref:Phosphodiesterase n=1 Tax=Paraburkholderia podalyriae TaxID=1938811 RepID=A0ABR7PYT5_9BURK|nr:phosphodiesterase [Paraburkholderia podalyriae]MBC8751451.1 phosphodiesterase [Paraburkholderia podalyriae]
MKIISHRGYWKEPSEKNTVQAFHRSFTLGFGTETDIRDLGGRLVISHDMPLGHEVGFSEMLDLAEANATPEEPLTLALNVKADGLTDAIFQHLEGRNSLDCFVFDMAVPDMRAYLGRVPIFTRISEVEPVGAWLERSNGIWLDAFDGVWYDTAKIENLLNTGKRVCVVSNELHRRDHQSHWELLAPVAHCENLILCTDLPEAATDFFEKMSGAKIHE